MAARFWNKQNASANWNATVPTNWGSASGVADNASVPGASDNVTFDGAGTGGNAAATLSASITVLSLTFITGYTQIVTINTSVTLTVAGNFTDNTAHGWTINGTGNLTISAASAIDSGGKTFPGNVIFSNSNTKTITNNDWTITGTLTFSGATTLNSRTITVGSLNMGQTCTGTTAINLTGGTWQSSGILQNNLTITGTVTISGGVSYNTGTLTCTSGTITATGSTLTIAASTTLNTSSISWNDITVSAVSTLTINSLLTVLGTLQVSQGVGCTFAGTTGFTANTFTLNQIVAVSITFANGVTYTITNALNIFRSRSASIVTLTSDHATNKAIITLSPGATCNVLASFTRIDASNGRPIWTFNGTITTCINIFAITDLSFVTQTSKVIQGNSNY